MWLFPIRTVIPIVPYIKRVDDFFIMHHFNYFYVVLMLLTPECMVSSYIASIASASGLWHLFRVMHDNLSVCLSICPSVRDVGDFRSYRLGYSSKVIPRSANIGNLVPGDTQNSRGIGIGSLISAKPAIFLKWEIAPMLVITNRKLHTHFRLVPKSTTSYDLAWTAITRSISKCMRFQSRPPRNF